MLHLHDGCIINGVVIDYQYYFLSYTHTEYIKHSENGICISRKSIFKDNNVYPYAI